MHSLLPRLCRKACCLSVIVLTLWLGGFGCIACCVFCTAGELVNECCASSPATSSKTLCSVYGCCQSHKESSSSEFKHSISEAKRIGCPLLPKQIEGSIVTAQPLDDAAFVPSVSASLFMPETSASARMPVNCLLPANRGSTYLRCCVLLI